MINYMISDTTYEKLCDSEAHRRYRFQRAVTRSACGSASLSQESGSEHRRKKSENPKISPEIMLKTNCIQNPHHPNDCSKLVAYCLSEG